MDASEAVEVVHPTQEEEMLQTSHASKTELVFKNVTAPKPRDSDLKTRDRMLKNSSDKTLSQTGNASDGSCLTEEERSSVTKTGNPRQMAMRRPR